MTASAGAAPDLSAVQVQTGPALVAAVASAPRAYGPAPGRLEPEVAEAAMLNDAEETPATLRAQGAGRVGGRGRLRPGLLFAGLPPGASRSIG